MVVLRDKFWLMNKTILLLIFYLLLPLSILAQINLLPKNTDTGINIFFGLEADSFDLKKGEFADRYENTHDQQVVTHSLSMGFKTGVDIEFKKTPVSVSLQYSMANLVASLIGGNEVDLVKNPIEQVFMFVSPPREKNIASVRQFVLALKTTLLSTSLRKRAAPGIYLYLVSGIGYAEYEGEEVIILDPPFQKTASWKQQHATLNLGGELMIFPSKKSNFLSLFLATEKKYLPDPKRVNGSIATFSFGFNMSF